ncbi:MAG TPA: hypothetical protein VF320_08390, partial [Acidimicrobiales bacterium]
MTPDAITQTAPEGVLVTTTSASTQSVPVQETRTPSPAPGAGGPASGAGGPPPVPRPRRLPNPIRPSAFGLQDVLILAAAAFSSLCL